MSRLTTLLVALLVPLLAAAIVFAAAGRVDLPMVWAVFGTVAALYVAGGLFADPGLMKERLRPGPGNRDRITRPIGALAIITHWVLAGLDVGRFRWSVLPLGVQLAGLAVFVGAMGVMFWVMRANPFYSSVVRVQTDRGQYVVTTGPYRFVRHPGYAASLVAMVSGGAALGSAVALMPLALFLGLFVRRMLLEDAMLKRELPGYAEYASRVRHRLVAGVF